MEKTNTEKPDYLLKIIITQFICMAVIIGVCLGVKFFFKETYKELKNWYQTEVCDDTDIRLVTEG